MQGFGYFVIKTIEIAIMVALVAIIQSVYGLLLAICVFIVFIIYFAFTLDIKAFGTFFEREMSYILVNALTRDVINFLITNNTFGQSIAYNSLLKGMRRQESFPEFLLVRILDDLEQQGIIRVEMNEFAQRSIILKDQAPFEHLDLW